VTRRAARHKGRSRLDDRSPSTAVTLPDDFVTSAHVWLGDAAAAFLAACARPPRLAMRANGLKGGLDALRRALPPEAAEWPRVPWWPQALLPPTGEDTRLAASTLARIGALYAQDPAALAAVAALDPRPGERVLDLCAAPGGKSTAIADRLRPTGLLVANDVDAGRARELGRTLERWGVTNSIVCALTPDRLAALARGFFDAVLVDAPCSGEAMFARRDRAAADWSPEHVRGCSLRQQGLLHAARALVQPGGRIVYSTCTFNPIENEAVIASYLAAHPHDALDDAPAYVAASSPGRPDLLPDDVRRPDLVRCARLWPHLTPGAGHVVARIRIAAAPAPSAARQRGRPADRGRTPVDADGAAVRAMVEPFAPGYIGGREISVGGDRAFLVPGGLPHALVAAAFAPGLELAERRGRTWRPAHALAMALSPDGVGSTRALDDPAAALFLSGQPVDDPLRAEQSGIALVSWQGYPLGWGRSRGGILAPLLPKGLLTPPHARHLA